MNLTRNANCGAVLNVNSNLLTLLIRRLNGPYLFPITSNGGLLSVKRLFRGLFRIFIILRRLSNGRAHKVFITSILVSTSSTLRLLGTAFRLKAIVSVSVAMRTAQLFCLFFVTTRIVIKGVLLVPTTGIARCLTTRPTLVIRRITTFMGVSGRVRRLFGTFSTATSHERRQGSRRLTRLRVVRHISANFRLVMRIRYGRRTRIRIGRLNNRVRVTFRIKEIRGVSGSVQHFVSGIPTSVSFFEKMNQRKVNSKGISGARIMALRVGVPLLNVCHGTAMVTRVLIQAKDSIRGEDFAAIKVSRRDRVCNTTFTRNRLLRLVFTRVRIFTRPLIMVKLRDLLLDFLLASGLCRLDLLPAGEGLVSRCFMFSEIT